MSMLADILLLVGCVFVAIGSLGLVRMPDVYNRLQAGTKAVTLGSMSLLLGVALHFPQWWPKILIIAGFILITNPLGSSTVARTALMNGIKPWRKEGNS